MSPAAKLGAFAVVVAGVFGAAMAVGAAVGPLDDDDDGAEVTAPPASSPAPAAPPRGVSSSASGYRLDVAARAVPAGAASALTFEIVDEAGDALTEFAVLHERPLHLIVLSRDLVGYHHLHPTMDGSGRWTAELPPLDPGSYRVFADFQPDGGENLTLAADLLVPGTVDDLPVPDPSTHVVVDGYDVTLQATPQIGSSELTFTVTADGRAVRTDPYLGAAGHLVAIRGADLAYLHVHPHDEETSSAVTFTGEFPTAGTYRLFFEFAHGGEVHTAAYTVVVPDRDHADRSDVTTTAAHDDGH